MKNLWRVCCIAALLLAGNVQYAHPDGVFPTFFSLAAEDSLTLSSTIGQCEKYCVISKNNGGTVKDFVTAAQIVRRENMHVVIDGPCYSACAIFADEARPQVCITPNAQFYFHQGSVLKLVPTNQLFVHLLTQAIKHERLDVWEEIGRFLPTQSPAVSKWIAAKGGFPADDFLEMDNAAAQLFWPTCK